MHGMDDHKDRQETLSSPTFDDVAAAPPAIKGVDPVYEAKARTLNAAIQEIGRCHEYPSMPSTLTDETADMVLCRHGLLSMAIVYRHRLRMGQRQSLADCYFVDPESGLTRVPSG